MYLIFSNQVFRLLVTDAKIKDEMIKEGETAVEVESFQTPMMPKLSVDEEGQEVVEWVSRQEFDLIRNPPAESEDVPMS